MHYVYFLVAWFLTCPKFMDFLIDPSVKNNQI